MMDFIRSVRRGYIVAAHQAIAVASDVVGSLMRA
jgi:hypothetical protein